MAPYNIVRQVWLEFLVGRSGGSSGSRSLFSLLQREPDAALGHGLQAERIDLDLLVHLVAWQDDKLCQKSSQHHLGHQQGQSHADAVSGSLAKREELKLK
jgi:hypothetical protein